MTVEEGGSGSSDQADPRRTYASDAMHFRVSVLHVDSDIDLSLAYTHLPDRNQFETVGYVRLRGVTVWHGVRHAGLDTDDERDAFLLEVLLALRIPLYEARRIVHMADHLSGSEFDAEGRRPPSVGEELDGSHLVGPGCVVGMLSGLLVGCLLAGWNGAVIGAFVGASTFPDLFMASWQAAHASSPRNAAEIHDTVAALLVTVGTIAGGVLGYLLNDGGFGQASGVFLGMAVAGFTLSALATGFSMVPFPQRLMIWLGPLIVGVFAGSAYSLWSSPVSLALAIVGGSLVAARVAARRSINADG